MAVEKTVEGDTDDREHCEGDHENVKIGLLARTLTGVRRRSYNAISAFLAH